MFLLIITTFIINVCKMTCIIWYPCSKCTFSPFFPLAHQAILVYTCLWFIHNPFNFGQITLYPRQHWFRGVWNGIYITKRPNSFAVVSIWSKVRVNFHFFEELIRGLACFPLVTSCHYSAHFSGWISGCVLLDLVVWNFISSGPKLVFLFHTSVWWQKATLLQIIWLYRLREKQP